MNLTAAKVFFQGLWALRLPLLVAAVAVCIWVMGSRIEGLQRDLAARDTTIQGQKDSIDAKALEITVLEAAMDAAQQQAEERAQAAAAAMARAQKAAQANQRMIDHLNAYRPETGDDCRDAKARLQEYRK